MLVFVHNLIAYVLGLGILSYFVLWVGGWDFLPRHIDSAGWANGTVALGIDLGLLALFGLQHSLMARPAFKQWLRSVLSDAAIRGAYVWASALAIVAICGFWQPLEGVVWSVQDRILRPLLIVLYAAGWGLSVYATFVIDHFELFGLRQAWRHWRGEASPAPAFREVSLYRWVRHPMQLGVLIGLWATPVMSAGHLLLAAGMTVYVLIGLWFEERDLTVELGPAYADYRRRVPRLIPLRWPR